MPISKPVSRLQIMISAVVSGPVCDTLNNIFGLIDCVLHQKFIDFDTKVHSADVRNHGKSHVNAKIHGRCQNSRFP